MNVCVLSPITYPKLLHFFFLQVRARKNKVGLRRDRERSQAQKEKDQTSGQAILEAHKH